jgi:signal transduction histidine kinase/CheY-like chemotaxis protein
MELRTGNNNMTKHSISRRFSRALISIVAIILLVFAALVIFVNSKRIDLQLKDRLDQTSKLAQLSLATPLWNLDKDSLNDFVEALFSDRMMVYVRIMTEDETIIPPRTRSEFDGKDFSFFEQSSQFLAKVSDISYDGKKVGIIQFAVSRKEIQQEIILDIVGIITLTILIITAISITSLIFTKRYIFRPLLKLKASATLIANGNLETFIDTHSKDEIGSLAKDLNGMRESIRHLIEDLRNANEKLEGYNKTLEQKVDQRTKELSQAMKEAQEARAIAEDANRAKSQFLANTSHEFRTPLNSILGTADLLWETTLTPEQQEYVHIFKRVGNNLLNLINDILDLSKVEADQITLENTEFDLHELIEKVIEMMIIRTHDKRLELIYHIEPDVPTLLVGDPNRLGQILINLLGNAVKFTEGGEVILRVSRVQSLESGVQNLSSEIPDLGFRTPDSELLLFSVHDNGIGIPPEKLDIIFGRFTQVDESTTRKYGGSGLGLAISKRLVELMGGRIWVESKLREGSTFYFTVQFGIPANREENLLKESTLLDLKGVKILIIEDNASQRRILKEILVKQGASVTEVENSEQGFAELQRAKETTEFYQLALVDCRMAGMSGFQIADQIKKNSDVVDKIIIILPTDHRRGDLTRCRELGLAGYLIKPIRESSLIDTIKTVLSKPKVAEEPISGLDRKLQPSTAGMTRPLNILLVEDSEDNRVLFQAFIKKTPYQLDIAENGHIAVEKFKSNHYDIVFMDIQMPVMDGRMATKTIREWEKGKAREDLTPIIALTAHAFKEDEQKSLEAGCTAYLTKPIKKEKVLEAILEYAKK